MKMKVEVSVFFFFKKKKLKIFFQIKKRSEPKLSYPCEKSHLHY